MIRLKFVLFLTDWKSAEQTQARFEKMEHLGEFLKELTNSSVPIDLEEFIKQYRYQSGKKFFR